MQGILQSNTERVAHLLNPFTAEGFPIDGGARQSKIYKSGGVGVNSASVYRTGVPGLESKSGP